MAVSAKDLELVRADITVGLSAMHDKDNPIMIGMAAYHFHRQSKKCKSSDSGKGNRAGIARYNVCSQHGAFAATGRAILCWLYSKAPFYC